MEELLSKFVMESTNKPRLLTKYVDDLLAVVKTEEVENMLKNLNSYNKSIKFTIELEKDGKIPFLDTLVIRKNNKLLIDCISSNTKLYLKWTSRSAWQAVTPLHNITHISPLLVGVLHEIIHHTATPASNASRRHSNKTCWSSLIQRTHQEMRGRDDIGYNFLIGDKQAEICEGCDFNVIGAYAFSYNVRSLSIALIGDWTFILPSRPVFNKWQQLIMYGINMGHIQRNYILLGHRQVKAADCPGTRLYNELKGWPHYDY
ncbi:peptidoglycan-recognition protein SB1-like [Eurosta solidaginis]|uniref:peptidoglycan-recognition protein SB1-like n=1 Tax=Eurosta solidaginis TaxID=178769 RepID=UPI003530F758